MLPAMALADAVDITSALRIVADSPRYPADLDAETVALPDRGRQPVGLEGATRWYRLELPAQGGKPASLAVHIPSACGAPVIVFNDELLTGDPASTRPGACRQHLVVPLPAPLWREGTNRLDVRVNGLSPAGVAAIDRAAGLSAVRVGSTSDLEPGRRIGMLRDVSLPGLIGSAMLMLGLTTLVVGWMNTRKAYLLWLGLLAAGWGFLTAGPPLLSLSMPLPMVEWTLASISPLIAAAAVLFLMRYAGMMSRTVEAVLFAQCIVVPASLVFAGHPRLFAVSGGWYGLLALEVTVAAAAALRVAWRVRRQEFWIMLGLLTVMSVTIFTALAHQYGWIESPLGPLMQLALPLGMTVLGSRLVFLEVAALRMAEMASRSIMERRVTEAIVEAERKFSAQADQRVEQVTERERKRIAADLHDDLGAKLLTIVHTSESDRISTLAREALEEMRLSVRGLTGRPVRLSDALGDWRAEVVSRLGQANVGATWQSPTDDITQTLPARSYVQTTRILREAVSNIIKHSGASRCTITGTIRDSDFLLTIQDNGKGIPMELDGKLDRGHGMTSMKQRAKGLQGQCLVESGPGFGTVIRLTVPL